jgi:hypothetical protein
MFRHFLLLVISAPLLFLVILSFVITEWSFIRENWKKKMTKWSRHSFIFGFIGQAKREIIDAVWKSKENEAKRIMVTVGELAPAFFFLYFLNKQIGA